MKKIFFIFIISIFILAFFVINFSLAADEGTGKELEINYPEFFGLKIEKTSVNFADYVKYIFYFVLGISGLVALGVIIVAGFRYLTSAGNVEKMADSKDQMSSAVIGLLLLFLSWIILNTINPQLIAPQLKPLAPTISDIPRGVFLCKKQVDVETAWNLKNQFSTLELDPTEENIKKLSELKKEFDAILIEIETNCTPSLGNESNFGANIPKYNYFYQVPDGNQAYFAVAYEKPNWEGNAQILLKPSALTEPANGPINLSKVKSIQVFKRNIYPDPDWKVTLYQRENYNIGLQSCENNCPYAEKEYKASEIFSAYITSSQAVWSFKGLCGQFNNECPSSIKIEGNLVVILGNKSVNNFVQSVGEYVVITTSKTNLADFDQIAKEEFNLIGERTRTSEANIISIIAY